MGKFCIRQTASGFKFDLKAMNGEVIASSEVYTSLPLCRKGILSTARCGKTENVADLTAGGRASNPKYEIFQDRSGEYRFRLKARNGQIIACSQGYSAKESCENGIVSVRRNVEEYEVEE